MRGAEMLQGADKAILTEDEQISSKRIGPTPHFAVEAVTNHREGVATVTLRCTWVTGRGFVLEDHDEEIELPAIGELADCKPGDVFRLVRSE